MTTRRGSSIPADRCPFEDAGKMMPKRGSSSLTGRFNDSASKWKLAVVLVFAMNLLTLIQMAMLWDKAGSSERHLRMEGAYGPSVVSGLNPQNPLEIPKGGAPALPSLRVADAQLDAKREIYGGAGDKAHLGGFTDFDREGVSPTLWTKMITEYGVKSLLDVGCGRGISTRFFLEHGVDVLCAEGSHDAVTKSFLPSDRIVEHDFSRGPWWPEKTYDAVWSVEFLEHVSRQYHFNYISAFRKAALIFVSSARGGGWHHVEIHPDDWWIRKYESYGFRYDKDLTDQVKQCAFQESNNNTMVSAPNGERYWAARLAYTMKVFINPMVASLPQHAHLFHRDGCFLKYAPKDSSFRSLTRPCGKDGETALPESMLPLKVTPDMYERWADAIRQGIKLKPAAIEEKQ